VENNQSSMNPGLALAGRVGEILIGNDLLVTRLGFGTMRITGKGTWGQPADRAEAVRGLRRAVELRINFIDTADSYGPGVSEEIIAEALYPYSADLAIATKGGFERPGPDRWVENGNPQHLRSACEGSLRRLRLDRIDLYQLHRIDPQIPIEDQLGAFKDLQAEGKIRHIGLSEVSVQQIQHARTIAPIVSVQNRYSWSIAGRKMFWNIAKKRRWASFRGSRLLSVNYLVEAVLCAVWQSGWKLRHRRWLWLGCFHDLQSFCRSRGPQASHTSKNTLPRPV
jgi:aryl-alcohol dehydrogenase-like predicted oxidoreductase